MTYLMDKSLQLLESNDTISDWERMYTILESLENEHAFWTMATMTTTIRFKNETRIGARTGFIELVKFTP